MHAKYTPVIEMVAVSVFIPSLQLIKLPLKEELTLADNCTSKGSDDVRSTEITLLPTLNSCTAVACSDCNIDTVLIVLFGTLIVQVATLPVESMHLNAIKPSGHAEMADVDSTTPPGGAHRYQYYRGGMII